ncbi:MAG: hypothetical protein LiPW15_472 [Parcubacteria group bacterium LiPW_15]|nr:MAG: hypothetical protein LiPW15_472 [Parcubacteria group bacterium LiPW_15]
MKKLLIFVPVSLLVTISLPAFAAEKTCDLSGEYKSFALAVQNPSYSQEGIQKELSARASLLSVAIGCAREDVIDLKNQILTDDNTSDSANQIKERVVESLDEAIRFYDMKKDSIKDQGIQGTKDLAREIKVWRDSNYDQLSGRVKNFMLWSSNQSLFEKASDRLSQSQLVVTSLKVLENEDSEKVYYDAKLKLETAQKLNGEAGAAIARGASSEETFGMIKNSLEALSNTYKNFFEISGKLNKTDGVDELVPMTDSDSKDE